MWLLSRKMNRSRTKIRVVDLSKPVSEFHYWETERGSARTWLSIWLLWMPRWSFQSPKKQLNQERTNLVVAWELQGPAQYPSCSQDCTLLDRNPRCHSWNLLEPLSQSGVTAPIVLIGTGTTVDFQVSGVRRAAAWMEQLVGKCHTWWCLVQFT